MFDRVLKECESLFARAFKVENEKLNENYSVLSNLVARLDFNQSFVSELGLSSRTAAGNPASLDLRKRRKTDHAKDISRQEQHLSPLCN